VRRLSGSHGVRCVEGVVNGTTNFILDRVLKGESFLDAVGAAQAAGFAEADPTTDLDGTDPSHKLAILATEVVGTPIEPASIDRDSIVQLDPARVRSAAACGCVLRLVARAHRSGSQLSTTVRLQTLPKDHPLAGATNEWNRILIHTTDGATTLVSGRGAGRWPTTEAVLADLFDIARLAPAPSVKGPGGGRPAASVHVNGAIAVPASKLP
jgi:homoserine dehydrogenase